MRRAIFITSGFVLLTLAAAWAYWTYRQYRSYQTLIPRSATSVIRIQADALATDIAWNSLWHAEYYSGSSGKRHIGFDRKTRKQMGITIPANIFLYQTNHTLSEAFPDIFFGSLPLTNSAALVAWLDKQLGMQVSRDARGTVALSERAIILIKERQALFAISPTKPTKDLRLLTEQLSTILRPDASVSVSKSPFREIQRLDGHLCVLGRHQATVDFEKGKVLFSLRLEGDAPNLKGSTPNFADSNAVSLWFQGPITDLLKGRQFHIGTHILHGDSLLSHYDGHMVVEWKGTFIQHDTIISYDYDENFEMTELHEILEKPVPEIHASLLVDTGLRHYLQKQRILHIAGDAISRDVFPLYQVKVASVAGGYLQFHTARSFASLPKPCSKGERNRFKLRVNFDQLDLHDMAPLVAPFVEAFSSLEASDYSGDAGMVVHGKLLMKNQQINSLVQLMMLPWSGQE
jgi:hypothetical protein